MGKTYAIVVGFVLLLVGIIGFVEGDKMMMGLRFNLIHNCIHVASGLVGLVAGLAGAQKGGRAFAQVFGVVLTPNKGVSPCRFRLCSHSARRRFRN